MTENIFSLVKSVTEYDMNNQIEKLVCAYIDSGDETFLKNSNAIKAEFFELWNSELAKIVVG